MLTTKTPPATFPVKSLFPVKPLNSWSVKTRGRCENLPVQPELNGILRPAPVPLAAMLGVMKEVERM